jgi:hypothetical protein
MKRENKGREAKRKKEKQIKRETKGKMTVYK